MSFYRNLWTTKSCPINQKLMIKVRFVCLHIMLWNISKTIFYDKNCLAFERDGFDGQPLYFCNVATCDEKIIGYAISHYNYATWCGKGMLLQDLYVIPDFRGKRVGSKLLKAVAKVCSVRIAYEICTWLRNIYRMQLRMIVIN